MSAPSAWTVYDLAKYTLGKKTEDLGADTYKVALFTASSGVGSNSLAHSGGTIPVYPTDTSNEVGNGNGYTTGGVTCAVTWANSGGTETMSLATATWNATSSGFSFRFAVLYNDTTKHLIAWCYGDSTPADVSVAAGNTLNLVSASGAFTLA